MRGLQSAIIMVSTKILQLDKDKSEIIVFDKKDKRVSTSEHLDSRALKNNDQVRNLGDLRSNSDLTRLLSLNLLL